MSAKLMCLFWTLCIILSTHYVRTASEEIDVDGMLSSAADAKAAAPVQCPECDERLCVTDLKCRAGEELREAQTVCGCCPGCVIVLGLGEPCSPTFGPSCKEGLVCDPTKRECVVKTGSCHSYQSLNIPWKPECLQDGTFAPRQCKGQKLTGRCFCYSPDGNKLFGSEWWADAANMTCACSRLIWQLQNAVGDKRTDVTLHCNQLGNFEDLQCDNGLCWCADEKTGDPITSIVPEHLINVLPCYNETAIGSQYLRKCESKLVAQARIGILMTDHGTMYRKSVKQNCDADGSYGHFQIRDDNIAICSWKDGTQMGSYGGNINSINGMTCNCARDARYHSDVDKEFNKICDGWGGYEKGQFDPSGMWYCVDKDGFAISNPMVIIPPNNIDTECDKLPSVP